MHSTRYMEFFGQGKADSLLSMLEELPHPRALTGTLHASMLNA